MNTDRSTAEISKDVCVVTQPDKKESEKIHAHQLLDILSAITSVSLLTANVSTDAKIRTEYEVIEISRTVIGDSILSAAVRFLIFQAQLCRAIARRDESMILFFGATSYLLPIAFARLLGRTVVVLPRGDVPLTLRLQWQAKGVHPLIARLLAGSLAVLEHLGYRVAHAIVTYTESMADELGLRRYEHKLYPFGARYVDTERFCPRVPFEERKTVVGFLGRLDEEKNVRMLAEVAKELPEHIVFRFIGDGDLREELEEELAGEIASGEVEFTGWVEHDEVPQELNRLRLLVLPSEPTEGLPTVILESMACGTPVYATPVSSVPDVIREGETGFLMNREDQSGVARDVDIIQSRKDLEEISANGRTLIENKYSFEAAVDRYWQIFQSVSE